MHIDFESVSMVTSQRSFCPVLEREGHELSRLPSVSMWTSWHFKNIAFCFLKKLPKVFNSPISNPSLQKETINMISSHCVKYQDACTEAVGSRAHENSSADVRACNGQKKNMDLFRWLQKGQ